MEPVEVAAVAPVMVATVVPVGGAAGDDSVAVVKVVSLEMGLVAWVRMGATGGAATGGTVMDKGVRLKVMVVAAEGGFGKPTARRGINSWGICDAR